MSHTELAALTSQVGGHKGVLTTEDGSLLIKPALPLELAFYQHIHSEPAFEALLPYVPKMFGTLKLEGEVAKNDESELKIAAGVATGPGTGIAVVPIPEVQKKDKVFLSISVLENISHPFLKPNIMDIKLGTILYSDDASPEKVQRMIETARQTTSLETGVRLTGFQVYDNATGQPVIMPKSYGKNIKAAELPEGMASFFPVSTPVSGGATEGVGLPAPLLLPILKAIRENVQEIRDVFAQLEVRMVGGSLLFVYEADWQRAEEGLKWWHAEESEDEDEDEDEEDSDGEEEARKKHAPHAVKLIDFAHTKATPGEGPDEGVLVGMDTVLRLLDGRIKEVSSLM